MKTLPVLTFILLCLCVTSIGVAQTISSQPIQVTVPTSTPYAITTQDANSRIWQSTDYQMTPSGEVITNTHSFTEICSGLNHWAGKWIESTEEIDILLNGTAVATNGQHQAYFPGDIYQGQIELVTPDGQYLQSRPLALSYFDGTNTVVIAELTNSVGLVGNNQVFYPNAFTGFKVDLRYTYTKSGFSQDVILRQQPPTPESLGLNGDTARLQIMTEFFSAPQPSISSTALPTQAGVSLTDESLGFGSMQMVQGRAFLLGQNTLDSGALVSKHWLLVNGRQILIEEVPVDAILEGLAALPMTAMNSKPSKDIRTASKHFHLPPQRLAAKNTSKTMMLAKAEVPMHGFVLDYQMVSGSSTNFTFQGDTTYYISGLFDSYGMNTFEGGAVIKYATNGAIYIVPGPPGTTPGINSKGSSYRPVIFTGIDDNTVGDSITGSTGNPTGHYYGNPMLLLVSLSPVPTLTGIRMIYASTALQSGGGGSINIYGAQFVNCQYGFSGVGATVNLRNALFANTKTNFLLNSSLSVNAQNVTFSGSGCLLVTPGSPSGCSLTLSNCVFANITNLYFGSATPGGSYNGFYNCSTFGTMPYSSGVYPFQSVGAGNYYLTNGSSFRNVGTINIDTSLLGNIKQTTTYPPILYSNVTVSINTTLNPQAQRDTDTPDLGYHYDPIDYLVDRYTITNASLTLTNGVAIASYNDSGIVLSDGSAVVSIGSPLYPNWFARYSSVQEQPIALGGSVSSGEDFNPNHLAAAPGAQFRFSKFACPAGGGTHLYNGQSGSIASFYANLMVQDCEFWSGNNTFAGGTNTVITLKNNLFARSIMLANPIANYTNNSLALSNNLFWNTAVTLLPSVNSNSNLWFVYNNSFDTCTITTVHGVTQEFTVNGYNAYIQCNQQLSPTNVNDKVLTSAFAYKTGPLGTFYQTNSNVLINVGSTTANLVGLYHYTVITNLVSGLEIKETNSTVDIGYHYVAVDNNGVPIDTNSDGIPDYLSDANGNGLVDSGEIGWNIAGDLGLKVIITRPRSGSILP